MLHAIFSDPHVAAQIKTILTDVAILIGSLLALVVKQSLQAIRDSHLGIVKKMIAERLVHYAEQTLEGTSTDKADYVASQLHAQFPKLDQEEIQHLLESAVHEMNQVATNGTQK